MLLPNMSNASKDEKKSYCNYVWGQALENLKAFIEPGQFDDWFVNISCLQLKDGTLFLSVPNNFTRDWIINNFFILIKKELYNIDPKIKKISLITEDKKNSNKKDEKKWCALPVFSKLNPKYIFRKFFICHENMMAYTISNNMQEEISENQHHNIFYFHADVGMGKTHLLQSIAASLKSRVENHIVEYLSAEKFMYNFIHAVKNNLLFELREKNTKVDTYIIDDFHFICGKESTQKEFSFIINSLIELGKTVIIASTISPYLLELNDQRTKSLLISSNVIHIKELGDESRLQLLEFFNKDNTISFNKDILKLLANKVESNVRELEAAIKNLTTYLTISCKEPTVDNICKYIEHHIKSSVRKISFSDIITAVTKFYRISKQDMLSKKRSQKIVLARVITATLAKDITPMTLKNIGMKLGDRNHATILYYIRKFSILQSNDAEFIKDINILKNSLKL